MKCCDAASLTAALLFTIAKRSLHVRRFNGKLKTARISCNGTQATKCSWLFISQDNMRNTHCVSNSDTFLGLWLPHSQNLQFTLFLWKGNLLANFVLDLLLGLAINERLFNFKLNWTKFSHSGLFICSKFVKQSYVYKDDEVILTLT